MGRFEFASGTVESFHWHDSQDELAAIVEDIAIRSFEMILGENVLVEETRTASIEIEDVAVDATFSYNLNGSGCIKGSNDEMWFFKLEYGGVYVKYCLQTLSSNDPSYADDTRVLTCHRHKANGTRGGLGKNQEALATALWHPLSVLMERELASHGWTWCGFNTQHNNNSMYRFPAK